LSLLPNALNDFLGSSNDTINYSFTTKSRSEYGTVKLGIQNLKSYPIIVQLSDAKEIVVRQKILDSASSPCNFENLKPSTYFIKIIIDENKNKKWDTGSFLERKVPEKIYHIEDEINVRANWILEEKIILD
jgi:uncharacterized protein (DUF2141 family)